MIKGSIQVGITLANMYAPNIGATEYIKQILMGRKGQTDRNTVTVRGLSTPLTQTDRSSRRKFGRETTALSDTLDQVDLIGISRAFHPKAAEYTYVSSALEMFSRIDHELGQRNKSQ